MPNLSHLPEEKRKDVARELAQSAFAVVNNLDGPGAAEPPSKRLFATLANAGPAHEKEFYGDGFNAARNALIDQEFDKIHSEALEHAKAYDECIKALQEAAPNFALASSALVRMWCISRYTRMLCQEDGPFWDLEMADEVEDTDGEEESEEEAVESDEDDAECSGEEEEEEDIVVATSSESDESDSSESDDEERARRERKRARKRARKEKRKRKREQKSSDDEEEEEEGGD